VLFIPVVVVEVFLLRVPELVVLPVLIIVMTMVDCSGDAAGSRSRFEQHSGL
jgi:hypothetical protein